MTNQLEQNPAPNKAVVITISLSPEKQMEVSVLPPDVTGMKLESWEIVGLLETAMLLVKQNYFPGVKQVEHIDSTTRP